VSTVRKAGRVGVRYIRTSLSAIVGLPVSVLKRERAVNLVMKFVQLYINRKSSAEALRFLFALDEHLYALQGRMSVVHGDGVHSKHRHMRYHDFFVNRVGNNETVLDIGCGIGAVSFDVALKAGAKVVAIDLSHANISIAQEKYVHQNIEYVAGDVLKALPGSKFDVVIMSNVLEHLPNRSTFLNNVTESTGARRLLLRVPLFERDWRVPLKKELGMEWRLDKTHYTEYTIEQFEQEMKDAKLNIKHQEIRWGEIWAEVEPE